MTPTITIEEAIKTAVTYEKKVHGAYADAVKKAKDPTAVKVFEVMAKEELNAKKPVAPIDMTKDLAAPLLGLFGNDDRAPSPEQVNQHEAELKKHGKAHEFHRYDGAGHGFFYWHRPLYRPEQAMDGWNKIWAFFGKYLKK